MCDFEMNRLKAIVNFSHLGNLRFDVVFPANAALVGSECRGLTSLPSNNNGLRRTIEVDRTINGLAALHCWIGNDIFYKALELAFCADA